MKANIHPKYYQNTQVVCACGNRFTVGSTMETIRIDLCNNCHPFYTGEQKYVDSASRIQKFQKMQETAKQHINKKVQKQKKEMQKQEQPKTLREMLMAVR